MDEMSPPLRPWRLPRTSRLLALQSLLHSRKHSAPRLSCPLAMPLWAEAGENNSERAPGSAHLPPEGGCNEDRLAQYHSPYEER